jgi:hypothetical protein
MTGVLPQDFLASKVKPFLEADWPDFEGERHASVLLNTYRIHVKRFPHTGHFPERKLAGELVHRIVIHGAKSGN